MYLLDGIFGSDNLGTETLLRVDLRSPLLLQFEWLAVLSSLLAPTDSFLKLFAPLTPLMAWMAYVAISGLNLHTLYAHAVHEILVH